MKKTILTLFISSIFLVLFSCTRENADPYAKLPPETQTGANTFGCIVNNKVFYPRTGPGAVGVNPEPGIIFWGDYTLDQHLYNEIDVGNYQDGKPVNKMIIHLQGLYQQGVGDYVLDITNNQSGIDGYAHNYVFARIYVEAINGWKYYGSYLNSGKVTVTRYDITNRIVSGTFSGKLRNGTDEIEIKNGRFDIKWSTVDSVYFP